MKINFKDTIQSSSFFCFLTSLIVFIFYFHTLGYSWKHFDENIIFQETILPIPSSLKEAFEMISLFGLKNHFEASNPFYSNISNIRGTPLDTLICLIIFSIFKKSAFAYHLFSFLIHILNSCLCFLILNKILLRERGIPWYASTVALMLALLWSLHPVNVESVLFVTNFGALITYLFCFLIIFYWAYHGMSLQASFLLFFLYLFPLFLNEYSVTLPIILFLYLFSTTRFYDPAITLKNAFLITLKKTLPLFIALAFFVVYFLFHTGWAIRELPLQIMLERIFWVSPQIFFHFLKLIFFPLHLSIDQTAFVKLSNSAFEPYGIFCSLLMFGLILISLTSLFSIRKKLFFYFFICFVPFFISLLPFLHIISPIYNLASERYLYLPLFFLIFGFSHVLSSVPYKGTAHHAITLIIAIVLCLLGTRSYIRTLDWKDSTSLLKSAVKIAPNNLYKGLREYMLATSINVLGTTTKENTNFTKKALEHLKVGLNEFKENEIKHQNKTPEVIKFYGLDPKTLKAKTAYLISYIEFGLNGDASKALEIFSPYVKDIKVLDSLILDFYYKILFNTKNINEAEKVLLTSLQQDKLNPILFVALSDLSEYKYNNLKLTEKYLKESFKYFPYDPLTLFGLKRLYQKLNKPEQFAFYSRLYGLRMHDATSLQEAERYRTYAN